jgi:hypothetical protein
MLIQPDTPPTLRSETNPEHRRIPGSEEYSFCESSTAIKNTWHIRKLDKSGKHPNGGITTPSLCGCVKPLGRGKGEMGGWDIVVDITPHHGEHNCPECWELFQAKA